jgi:hypothetical protein
VQVVARKNSANHGLINPLSVYVVYAPVRDLPAAFCNCCPVTVLEWNSEHFTVPPPFTQPGSLISHCFCPKNMSVFLPLSKIVELCSGPVYWPLVQANKETPP